jgi:hypothetical protein
MASNSPTLCQGLASNCQEIFANSRPKTWHDMTQMNKRELLAHHNIPFETHMEVYERSSSSELGGMASNSPTLCQGLIVLDCQEIFANSRTKTWHDMTQMNKENCLHITISLLRPIWKCMKGLAAVNWVAWLQTVPLFANDWLQIVS